MAKKLYSEEEVKEYKDKYNDIHDDMRWMAGSVYLSLGEVLHLLLGNMLAIDVGAEYITILRLDTEEY